MKEPEKRDFDFLLLSQHVNDRKHRNASKMDNYVHLIIVCPMLL